MVRSAIVDDKKPTYTDVSGDARAWDDVCPDQYFGPEHVMGKEVLLQIAAVVLEKYPGDELPKAVLKFSNDKKWLRVSRDSRQALKELFGISPALSVGKWITITAGPNAMKTIVVKILPRQTVPPTNGHAQQGATVIPPDMAAEMEEFRRFKALQRDPVKPPSREDIPY